MIIYILNNMNKKEEKKETEEIYTLAERWIIFITLYILSLVTSIIFICYRVKIKKSNIIIYVICVIYSSLFAFLNVIAVFDLGMINIAECQKLMSMIEKYYKIFNWIDKISGYIVFDIIIYYIESGWYRFPLRLADRFIRPCCKLKKLIDMKKNGILCKTLVIQSIYILLAGAILTILIVYRKHFGLNSILDYIECILDCYSIFEIYSAVGFFLLKCYKDCCKIYNKRLIRRYYRYSQMKIIEKTNEYLDNIKNSYNLMKENAPIFQNGDSSYHKYLQKNFNDIQIEINELIGEGNSIIINNTGEDDSEAKANHNIANNNFNLNEKKPTENPIVNQVENSENFSTQKIEHNINQKLDHYKIATALRKFKESKRRINKLKKLSEAITEKSKKDFKDTIKYQQKQRQKGKKIEEDEKTKEGEEEKTIEESISNNNNNKENPQKQKNEKGDNVSCGEACGGCCDAILVCYSLFFILINDILLPLLFKYGIEEGDMDFNSDKSEKEKNVGQLILSIIIIFPVLALCSTYTFIMIYTHTKKNYITGDFLYDKDINDSLNLLKSVEIICGYSFAIVYCNLYYWKALDKFGEIGKPIYYEKTFIPDYKISGGLTIYYIIKLVIIIFSIIAHLKFDDVSAFENDLAEFYLCKEGCKYDSKNELENIREKNAEVMKILNSGIKDDKK